MTRCPISIQSFVLHSLNTVLCCAQNRKSKLALPGEGIKDNSFQVKVVDYHYQSHTILRYQREWVRRPIRKQAADSEPLDRVRQRISICFLKSRADNGGDTFQTGM